MTSTQLVEVVAGVLVRPAGRFLLASRPVGKVYAGYWEFPGGKIEPGEAPYAALVRELQEELAITVTAATPWLVQQFVYPHAHVRLRFYRVSAWQGEPQAQEGQQLNWQTPGQLDVAPMLLICTPIFLPVIKAYGIDPIHFALVMVLAGGMGLVTPPIGSVLFIGTSIGKITVAESMRSIWPFWLAGLVVLLIVAMFPQLSLWLPAVLKH